MNTSTSESHRYSLQEYLSIGYICLLVLGIVDEVVFYQFLGINILDYSGISDILISPVNTLFKDYRLLIIIVFFIFLGYLFYFRLMPYFHFKNRENVWYRKLIINMEKSDRIYAELRDHKRIDMLIFFIFCMFIGLKIGEGRKISQRIHSGNYQPNHTLVLSDNTTKRARVIGQNSMYLFFVSEGEKQVTIMPISGNLKEIRKLVE
jgi:hypothetical protein